MLPTPQELVQQILDLHASAVDCWHSTEFDNSYDGLLGLVCTQHHCNFLLWHEEDIARSPHVSDQQIVDVKRSIDRYNQQRNDWIEKIDERLIALLAWEGIQPAPGAALNTETPGSAIDRLSILALRTYHYQEQLLRDDIDLLQRSRIEERFARCLDQNVDLSQSLVELLADIFSGRKRLKVYRQMKMYNDPIFFRRSKQHEQQLTAVIDH